jgi:formamidopyrimidine-DNA glycosylase
MLYSAPIFEVGRGDPLERLEMVRALGPDILPYADEPAFDVSEFLRRLRFGNGGEREIGAALLDQTVCAGIGNYLRADILFECRLDPFMRVGDLSSDDLTRLCETIPRVARRAYETGGATLPDSQRERVNTDPTLRYGAADQPAREYGTRHWTFRRTSLPCLICGTPIRQLRQTTRVLDDGEEKERIIYFCPQCQGVTRETKRSSRKVAKAQGKTKEMVEHGVLLLLASFA